MHARLTVDRMLLTSYCRREVMECNAQGSSGLLQNTPQISQTQPFCRRNPVLSVVASNLLRPRPTPRFREYGSFGELLRTEDRGI
jgi:hypothetical protein